MGRLTLEWWLAPRLAKDSIHRWPGTEVVGARSGQRDGAVVTVELSNGERLNVDHVVFATGYKADVAKVPYLRGLLDRIEAADGFPLLDESFGSSLRGLHISGYAATRDFGPFFGVGEGEPCRRDDHRRSALVAEVIHTAGGDCGSLTAGFAA